MSAQGLLGNGFLVAQQYAPQLHTVGLLLINEKYRYPEGVSVAGRATRMQKWTRHQLQFLALMDDQSETT